MHRIRVAIAGVGNCASSLIQGISFYRKRKSEIGLMYPEIGGYRVSDIEIVAAFDVDKRKIGKDVSEAIFIDPNCTVQFSRVAYSGVVVCKGPVLDGIASHMKNIFLVDRSQPPSNIVKILKRSKAEMLICYLPVGSKKASRFYAQAALNAQVGFINAIPEFICSDDSWIRKFEKRGLPCAGDDIKSQVGATIIHRSLARLIQDRGHSLVSTYQLNCGGNTDFQNMLEESRLMSKRISKTQAVTSILDLNHKIETRIGPSDFISHLKDNKICYINIKGRQFGEIPFEIELKLSVEDSPNSAGVMVNVIRCMKLALHRGLSGNLEAVNAYFFKSPKIQYRDDVARIMLEKFIQS